MRRLLRLSLPLFCVAIASAISSTNVDAVTVTRSIVAGTDDAEETLDPVAGTEFQVGDVETTSSDLELGSEIPNAHRHMVATRFTNITIPRGAPITSASIQFMMDEPAGVVTNVRIFGELAANSATFAATPFNLTSRARTSNSVVWNGIPAWSGGTPATGECVTCPAGPAQRTPDLASIIQQIVNQPAWDSGSALSILILPEPITYHGGRRAAISFEDVNNPRNAGRGYQTAVLTVDFVPEPASCVLAAVAAIGLTIVRQRYG
jgi:hypothetical protein